MQPQIKELDFTGQNIYAGIDVHKNSWNVSIYSDDLYHKTISQPPRPEALYGYLSKHFPKGTYYSAYEAGFCGFWIHNQLQSLGINSLVVNPADIPTTDKEKKHKTDKVDSNKLAKHLRNGDLDPIYIHNVNILEDRNLLRTRRTVVKELTRYKNRIKSDLYFFGIEIPENFSNKSYWSKRFLNWLSSVKFRKDSGDAAFGVLLDQIILLRSQLLEINRKIRVLSRTEKYHKRVTLLLSIPGVGKITAMTFLTEVEDINRFANLEKLRSYVGLTPSSHSSGDKAIHGEMINRGNRFIKSSIIESAWVAARRDPALHLAYIRYRKRMDKNKAIVRIACKLLDRINFVLKNEKPYISGTE